MDSRKNKNIVNVSEDASGANAGSEESLKGDTRVSEVMEIVSRKNVYIRRQVPVEDVPQEVTEEQLTRIKVLDENLAEIVKRVMSAGKKTKEECEEALEEIRANLNQIIKMDPARYEAPLGDGLESAIIKIYTVLGR